ncbi:unnamed protein product [Moneuplotes crassus]|uniref:Uncharacterized protein n=1 Tax=Euplotes crassus TaxID=5936 RepID=A0AAD1UP29_EUPCR|nr:unnamed protein product [Moneuplotes crassus]
MFPGCDIPSNFKNTQMHHLYSNGSQNCFAPVVSLRPNGSMPPQHFQRRVENSYNGNETTPYGNYEHRGSLQSRSFAQLGDQNYSLGYSPDESVPSLNYVSERLTSNTSQMVPLIQFNSKNQERYIDCLNQRQDTLVNRKTLPTIVPTRQGSDSKFADMRVLDKVEMSPPKLGLARQAISGLHNIPKSQLLPKPLRKRVRSNLSTDSCESSCYKFAKTSERFHGSKRAKGRARNARTRSSPESRSKRNHFRKSSSPKTLPKRESYNMKRLDLGHSIQSVRHQQELKSRLKVMVFREKTLKEDLSIVVPSLPITLIPSMDIPKIMEE